MSASDSDLDGCPDAFDSWPNGESNGDKGESEWNPNGLLPNDYTAAELVALLDHLGIAKYLPPEFIPPTEPLDKNNDGLLTATEAVGNWGTEILMAFSNLLNENKGFEGTPAEGREIAKEGLGFIQTAGLVVSILAEIAPELLESEFGEALNALASMPNLLPGILTVQAQGDGNAIAVSAGGTTVLTFEFLPSPDGGPGLTLVVYDEIGNEIDPESLGGDHPFTKLHDFLEAFVGDPVDTASGELIYDVEDLRVPGRGVDFVLTRHYGSRSTQAGILGHNWSIPMIETYALAFPGANSIAVCWGDGTSAMYQWNSTTEFYEGTKGEFGKIRYGFEDGDPDAPLQAPGLVLRKPDGTTYHFCFPAAVAGAGSAGVSFLKKVSDPYGNALIFERDKLGHATKITDTLGQVVTLTYDPDTNLLSEVHDSQGRSVRYFYDEEKRDLLRAERPEQPVLENDVVTLVRPAENYVYWDHPSGWANDQDNFLNHNLQSVTEDGAPAEKLSVTYYTELGYSYDKVATQVIDGYTTRYRYQELGAGTALGVDTYQPTADHVTEVRFDSGTVQRFIHEEGALIREETINGVHDSNFQLIGGQYTNEDESVTHAKWFKVYEYDDEYRLLRTARSTDQLWPIARDFVYAYDSTNPDRFQQKNLLTIIERPSTPGAGIPDPIAGFAEKRTDFAYDPVTARPVEAVDHFGRVWRYVYAHQEHLYDDVQDWPGVAPWGILPDNPPATLLGLFGLGDVNEDGLQVGMQELVRREDPEVFVADSAGPQLGSQLQLPVQLAHFNGHGDVVRFRGVTGVWTEVSYTGGRATRVDDDPTGVGRIQRIGYDAVGRPAWQWDTQNHLTLATYNANGQPIEYRQSPVHVHSATHCLYGEACLQSPTGDPGDIARQLFYDRRGNVVAETGSNFATAQAGTLTQSAYGPLVRQWMYDSSNRVSEVAQKVHNLSGATTSSATWQFEYDGEGREWRVTLPDGAVTTHIREARGLVTRQEFAASSGSPLAFQEFDFDAFGDIVASTNAFGHRTNVERDGFGRPHKLRTPEGVERRITLDAIDRVIVDQTWDGPTKVAEKRHQYDDGNRVLRTEIDNITIGHDGSVSVGTPSAFITEKGWGLRPSECLWDVVSPGANPVITRRYFDDLGRLEAEYQGATNIVGESYQYDEEGRLLARTVHNDGLGTVGGVSPSESMWQYHYDRFGRLTHTIDPNGNSTISVMGAQSLPIKEIDANGKYTEVVRDSLGNPIFRRDYSAQGTLLRTLITSYDAQGRIVVRRDAKGNQTSYAYDELGRHFKRTFADASFIQHNYDIAGRLHSIDNPGGVAWVYGYDDDSILNSITTNGPVANVLRSLTRDALGRVITCTETTAGKPTTSVRRTLDALGSLVEEGVSVGGGAWTTMSAEYSQAALREQITWPSGRSASYGYDGLGRLTTVTGSTSGQIASCDEYWGMTRVRSMSLQSGSFMRAEFDPAGRALFSAAETATGTLLSGLSYEYDVVGNMLERTRLTDGRLEKFDYDLLDRIEEWRVGVQEGVPDQRTVSWLWDGADNLDLYTDTEGGATLDSVANNLNQQTSLTPTLISVGWTARGEESARVGAAGSQTFVWDALGRPMSSQFPAGGGPVTVDWLFDGFGRLLERTDSQRGTVEYTWLGSVLAQTDSSLSGIVEVVPGVGSAPLARIWNGQGPSYYHVEATGNVLGIFSPTALLEAYEYEPFGDVRNAITGQPMTASALSNELLFGSAPHDLEQKWVHFGARMYDAGLGRFASRDPIGEDAGQNLYSYALANPLRYSDRSGLAPADNQMPLEAGSSSGLYDDRSGGGNVKTFGSPIDVVNKIMDMNGGSFSEFLEGAALASIFDLEGYLSSEGYQNADMSLMSPTEMLATIAAVLVVSDWSTDGLTSEQATSLSETRSWLQQGQEAIAASLALNAISIVLDFPEFAASKALQAAGMSESAADATAMATMFAFGGIKNGISVGLKQVAGEALQTGAKKAGKESIKPGTKVYRVWGGASNPDGRSWSTVNPADVGNYRAGAGLPDTNSGEFISEGFITNPAGITLKSADPLHGNPGGLPELVVPNPAGQIHLTSLSNLDPAL